MNKILQLKLSNSKNKARAISALDVQPYNTAIEPDVSLMESAVPNVLDHTHTENLITKGTLSDNGVVENSILDSDYTDPVRGSVIRNKQNDCSYRRVTFRENDNREKQWCFTWSEGCHSMITNPFKGKSLDGATISFWARVPNYFTLRNHSAFLTFLGNLKHMEHPSHADVSEEGENDVITTPFLEITSDGRISFQEAYDNTYFKDMEYSYDDYNAEIPPYRHSLGRRWEHIIISITNKDIEFYVNGVRLEHPKVYKGKRFNGGNGNEGNAGMTKLLDFISDEDTNLFLGLSILSDEAQCESILYDNICFYDEAVDEYGAFSLFNNEIT